MQESRCRTTFMYETSHKPLRRFIAGPASPRSTTSPEALTLRSLGAAVISTALVSVVVSVLVVAAVIVKAPRGDQGPSGIQCPAGKAASSKSSTLVADAIVQAIRANAPEVAIAL